MEEGVQELGRGGDGGEVEEDGGGDSRTWKYFQVKITYLYALAQNTKFCF